MFITLMRLMPSRAVEEVRITLMTCQIQDSTTSYRMANDLGKIWLWPYLRAYYGICLKD